MSDRGVLVSMTERSLNIVETVQRLDGARASELADEMDLAVSTVHKHLQTLMATGYLRKSDGQYRLGFRFLGLGEHVKHSITGFKFVVDAVDRLSAETGEEVDFSVESNGRAVTVYEAYRENNPYRSGFVDTLNNRWEPGTYYPLHAIAPGKAILSRLSPERVNRIVDRWGLSARGPETITNKEHLRQELERSDERGYATTTEEYARGLCGVARAFELDAGFYGAIGIALPAYRFEQPEVFEQLKVELLETVVEVESALASD
jgi:IclR family acetate operon transcriptional repressor